MGALAVLELLDREGQVRASHTVTSWPLRIGRGLDNDLVLSDPHVAAQHLSLEHGDDGLALIVGQTANGVRLDRQHLRSGERRSLAGSLKPLDLAAGRTRMRLRLPEHPLASEVPLAAVAPRRRRALQGLLAGAVLLAALLFRSWLETDPDGIGRALGNTLLTSVSAAALWCGLWALLSKTFTRQGRFDWHLRVLVYASIAWFAVDLLSDLLAFSMAWPWASDFGFVATYAIGATALYFHLLAVEPARPRMLQVVAVTAYASAVLLSLWFNQQRIDQFGDELYMNHLFPPMLRLARPAPVERFVEGLQVLKPTLDRKAQEPPAGDTSNEKDNDDDN